MSVYQHSAGVAPVGLHEGALRYQVDLLRRLAAESLRSVTRTVIGRAHMTYPQGVCPYEGGGDSPLVECVFSRPPLPRLSP